MPYFILGLAILIGIYFLVRGIRRTNPKNLQRTISAVVTLLMVALIAFLTLTGRLGPLGWGLFVLPMLLQWRGILRGFKNMRGPTPGRNSDIETRYLRMTLEHDSGVLRGTVIAGTFSGKNLDELSLSNLVDLFHEVRVADPKSASILESYMDRVHGPDWRGASQNSGAGQKDYSSAPQMGVEQAYEILGLKSGASDDEIREAHRNLLKTNHPDRGGSTWLAAQINLAKDLLLPDG